MNRKNQIADCNLHELTFYNTLFSFPNRMTSLDLLGSARHASLQQIVVSIIVFDLKTKLMQQRQLNWSQLPLLLMRMLTWQHFNWEILVSATSRLIRIQGVQYSRYLLRLKMKVKSVDLICFDKWSTINKVKILEDGGALSVLPVPLNLDE